MCRINAQFVVFGHSHVSCWRGQDKRLFLRLLQTNVPLLSNFVSVEDRVLLVSVFSLVHNASVICIVRGSW